MLQGGVFMTNQSNLVADFNLSETLKLRQSDSAAKSKLMCIAESVFNRMPPMYSFTENMARHIEESVNVIFHNRKVDKQIAYFRYKDGSTMHLSGKVAYYSAPCTDCLDVLNCKCSLAFDLRQREYNGVVGSKFAPVIDSSLPLEELDL